MSSDPQARLFFGIVYAGTEDEPTETEPSLIAAAEVRGDEFDENDPEDTIHERIRLAREADVDNYAPLPDSTVFDSYESTEAHRAREASDPAYAEMWRNAQAKRNAFSSVYPDIDLRGSYECADGEYSYLYIPESEQRVAWNQHHTLDLSTLVDQAKLAKWSADLAAFCRRHEIPFVSPAWHMVAVYG